MTFRGSGGSQSHLSHPRRRTCCSLRQQGAKIEGAHQGDFDTRDVSGVMDGARVTLTSRITERTGNALNYRFTGELSGDRLSGTLDMGEYRSATWTASRVASA